MINPTFLPGTLWPGTVKEQTKPSGASAAGISAKVETGLEVLTGPLPLLRFLLVIAATCGMTCLYLWQLSTVSAIELQTLQLQSEVRRLERANVDLMIKLAAYNTPAVIEEKALALGMIPADKPIYVSLASPMGPAAAPVAQHSLPGANERQGPIAWLETLLTGITTRISEISRSSDLIGKIISLP